MTEFSELSSENVSERQSSEAREDNVVVGRLILDEADSQIPTTDPTTPTPTLQLDDTKHGSYFNDITKRLSHRSERQDAYGEKDPEASHSDVLLASVLSLNGDISGRNSNESGMNRRTARSSSSLFNEDDAVENYDELKIDHSALVADCRGGGLEKQGQGQEQSYVSAGEAWSDLTSVDGDNGTQIKLKRRESIQITLEKTSKQGRYVLKANDPEIRDILRAGLQREAEEAAAALASSGNGKAIAGTYKKRHKRFRDLVFTRQFTTFDRQNPLSSQSPFHGFFTLFWLICAALLIRVAAHNQRTHGSVFGGNELMHMMFDRDLVVMGLTDGAMCAATIFGFLLQRTIHKGLMSWNGSGWIIQNVWQMSYLMAVVGWTFYREWPWTHSIFIVLHAMVFLMKQHSYAFYNGYLSQVYRRKVILERKLEQLDKMDPVASPTLKHSESVSKAATGYQKSPHSSPSQTHRRHKSMTTIASTDLQSEESEISRIARAIEKEVPLDTNQLQAFKAIIEMEIDQLAEELRGKCTSTANCYPKNLNLTNFADWTCLPTLVYELEYPRQEHRNWWYIAEKTAATFGVIWVMMMISQAYIYPPVTHALAMKEAGLTLSQRSRELPLTVIDMLLPLLLEQLLSWYVIWECLLNVLAEVTLFADRGFYGDWWNSVSWDQYARDWNRPVHNFLLRHVYHSSISALQVSKLTATFMTFLLSALVHELVMFVLFKKVRGYLFLMQLMQVPLVMMSRTKLLKGKDVLGNVVFWIGMFVGPSLLTSLYLIV